MLCSERLECAAHSARGLQVVPCSRTNSSQSPRQPSASRPGPVATVPGCVLLPGISPERFCFSQPPHRVPLGETDETADALARPPRCASRSVTSVPSHEAPRACEPLHRKADTPSTVVRSSEFERKVDGPTATRKTGPPCIGRVCVECVKGAKSLACGRGCSETCWR